MNTNKLNPCSSKELSIREGFKKEYKLSCPVLDDHNIFHKCLKIWNLEQEWKEYLDMSKRIGDVITYRRNLVNQIVNTVQHVKGFDTLTAIPDSEKHQGPRSYLIEENVPKRMVSVDLIKANYQSLKKLGSKFVLDTENYNEFIQRFTREEALIKSRMLRQLIFGLLKPDVQGSIQRQMIYDIIDCVKEKKDFPILHLTNDEVVFEIKSDQDLVMIQESLQKLPHQFRVEEFQISKIKNPNNEAWFVKINDHGKKRKIMGVHIKFLFQVYNHLHHLPNQTKDFWWRERGRLCALLEAEKFS